MKYEVNRQTDENYAHSWFYKTRNEINQILVLEIYLTTDHYINIKFYITTKRKHGYQYLQQTGKDGLKSLLWAKACVMDFLENPPYNRIKQFPICVYADDLRRMDVYKRALIPLGFKEVYNKGAYLLYKWK